MKNWILLVITTVITSMSVVQARHPYYGAGQHTKAMAGIMPGAVMQIIKVGITGITKQ